MHTIEESIEVDVPVRTAYNQWTQFEDFSEFMEGVEAVRQVDEKTLDWRIKVGGKEEEFRAEIVEQKPDRVIAWRSIRGRQHAGSVEFEEIDPSRTLVRATMTYDVEGAMEKAGDALGVLRQRVKGDMKRFKKFIEERRTPTGAWRGEVEGGRVERTGGGRTL